MSTMSTEPLISKPSEGTAGSEQGLLLAVLFMVLFGVGAIFLVSA